MGRESEKTWDCHPSPPSALSADWYHSGRDVASLFLDTGEKFCSKTEAALLVLLEGADFIWNRAWQSACFRTLVSHGDGIRKQAKASNSKVPVATSGTVAPPELRGSWEEVAKKGP